MDQPLPYAELLRRIESVIRIGRVEEADYDRALLRVRSGEILTEWIPWITQRAGPDRFWWAPEVGEQVLVLGVSGDLAQGVVLPALFSTQFPKPADDPDRTRWCWENGSYIDHDRAAGVLTLSAGTIHLNPGGTSPCPQ